MSFEDSPLIPKRARRHSASGWPMILAGALLIVPACACVSWLFGHGGVPQRQPLSQLIFKSELFAVPAAALVLGGLYYFSNAYRRPMAGNLALSVILGSAIVMPFAVIGALALALNIEGARGAPAIKALRRTLQADDLAYRDQISALKIATFVDPGEVAKSFKPDADVAALDRARAADADYQKLIDGQVREARARLAAVPMSDKQRATALANFDLEFTDDDGDLPALRRYETYYLTAVDFEVSYLTHNHGWKVVDRKVVFPKPEVQHMYDVQVRRRQSVESYLVDLAGYSEARVRGSLGAPTARPNEPIPIRD